MAFVALYKCYRGGEWFRTSLESIRPAVDAVVAVFGPSWIKTDLPENCMEPLRQFARENPSLPVHIVLSESNQQDEQYKGGMNFILSNYRRKSERLTAMIVDTDEIWMGDDAMSLRQLVDANPTIPYFTTRMRTYIRSPLYEITPSEPNCPTVAVNCLRSYDVKCRFSGGRRVAPSKLLPDRYMYHYSFVRADEADIRLKFFATESQESVPSNRLWLDQTWPRLPNVVNFHMAKGYERCWQGIRLLRECDVPKVILDLPFIQDLLKAERIRLEHALLPAKPQLRDQPRLPPGRSAQAVPNHR